MNLFAVHSLTLFFLFYKHRGVFASHSISVVVLPSPIFKPGGYVLYLQLITENKTHKEKKLSGE